MAGAGTDVLVVDDDAQFRTLATTVLEQGGLRVVAAVDGYDSAVEKAGQADVAVVDLRLRGKGGVELTRELTERGLKVLIYTAARDRESLRAALQGGALGVVLKEDSVGDLGPAVRVVARGAGYMSPAVPPLLDKDPEGELTPREREVLYLLATGLTNEALAKQLGISPETTRTQLKSAMQKLGATTRVHAVAIAGARGEIQLP